MHVLRADLRIAVKDTISLILTKLHMSFSCTRLFLKPDFWRQYMLGYFVILIYIEIWRLSLADLFP